MAEAENQFHNICQQINNSVKSQMFGKLCYKIGNKAFVSFFQNEMVFKLDNPAHAQALALEGAHLFDPAGNGRAMKAWVQVPFEHSDQWQELSEQALNFVANNS